MIKNAIEFIIKSLVEHPDKVVVESTLANNKTRITIHVDSQDLGKIIGKEGRTIKAIRALAASLGTKENPISVDLQK